MHYHLPPLDLALFAGAILLAVLFVRSAYSSYRDNAALLHILTMAQKHAGTGCENPECGVDEAARGITVALRKARLSLITSLCALLVLAYDIAQFFRIFTS